MAHLKRLAAPKSWPIKRKGPVFVTRQNPRAKEEFSIPISFVLRDMLRLAQKAREVKQILGARKVLVNGKARTDPKFPAVVFDVIEIPDIGKTFHVSFTKLGKISVAEGKASKYRLARVESKTAAKKGKIQLNLFDGTNILIDKNEYAVGDVLKLAIPKNEIQGKLSPVAGAHVFVIGGKHTGETAKIKALEFEKTPAEVLLENAAGEFRTRFKNVYAVEAK